nr:hypothetical protein [Vibrio parahaemolyticus]
MIKVLCCGFCIALLTP